MDKTNPIIDKLFSAGAHFGYAPSRRHPSTSRFLFGAKSGVEIFDLEKTAEALERAKTFVKGLGADKKVLLFVSGKAEARETLERAAQRVAQPYCAGRWIGGSITNFSEIKKRLNRLADLTSMREKGELAKFTKKERLLIDREITDLETMFGGLRGLEKTPDALFVIDPKQEAGAVEEARQKNIPVIALMNSDCDTRSVDYPIPANDASRDTITLVLNELTTVYAEGTPKS